MQEQDKYRAWWVAAVIVVILIVGYLVSKPKLNNREQGTNQTPAVPTPQNNIDNKIAGEYVGTLKVSDDFAKGNLKLVTPDHIIYIHTTRDFSSLIDTEVGVKIDGNLDSFRLISIEAK